LTFGANYDPGNWFVMGEFAMNRTDALGDSNGWYITGGYRIKNFTPYLTYSQLKALSNPGLGFPPAGQQNTSAGVRWDFYKNFDLKLQYEHINLDAGSAGTLSNIQFGFQPGGTVNVFSTVIDFVF
jgi:predicted porin